MRGAKVLSFFLVSAMFLVAAHAQEVKEHPLIRPFPGSVLDQGGTYHNFSEYTFTVKDAATGKTTKKTVQGKFWKLTYRLYDANGNWDNSHSALEYKMNYKQAALERGGEVLYEDPGHVTFTIPSENGGKTWCAMHIWNKSQQDLRIIEEAGFKKSLTFGPAEMKAALDADGRVELHDILFDTDKSTLQPASAKQLQHVVTLLKTYPKLQLEVQGHTDNQGADDYNLKLSQRRAETVVAYLGLFGIDAARIVPKGYGETRPVASNNNEAGRSRNRRVELVK